ncbi:multiple epidermal growth factor-like domains protein 10 [Lytechinus variegatus]|uniref:multiple epidermal growth factor-like domains protein 10 n=1 Tax=Lytechinus variegatus TaxID=7654 RepID=UPI001BB21131|nr:multiple epidermal growth factor-like domains protein 10 [Lytechinus variegatus]
MGSLKDSVKQLEKEKEVLIAKLDDLENRGRRKNIVLFGIPEHPNQDHEDCLKTVTDFLQHADVSEDDCSQIERCHQNCNLEAVPNSNQTMNVTIEHHATAVVACDSGYTSDSGITTELTCDNGTISPSPPTCSAICTVDSDCLNGGTCNTSASTCNCTSDFTGLNCETENCNLEAVPNSNQTMNVTVEHDATAVVACDSGYTSDSGITTELTCDNGTISPSPPTCSAICTTDIDCLNGGTCNTNTSTCNCTSDFTGLNCETKNCQKTVR